MPFYHRGLRVYDEAVDWTLRVHELTRRLPWEWRHLGDQLRRAASSTVLNIAEGAAEHAAEQRRFYRIARRSAAECEGGFYMLRRAGVVSDDIAREAERRTNQISAMLTALIRRSAERGT